MRTVLFYRHFEQFRGGHLKVFDYFEHVRSSERFQARIRFSPTSAWDPSNPWFGLADEVLAADEAPDPSAFFVAGNDWDLLDASKDLRVDVPVLNLMQSFQSGAADHPLHRYVSRPAIRICVSEQLQAAVEMNDATAGPVVTVPIGFDHATLPAPVPFEDRDIDCLVLDVKGRRLGQGVAARLRKHGHRVLLVEQRVPRAELLEVMARSRVTAHLPERKEGAYLPALESMALGAFVVCPDSIGNRSFCRDGETCFVPKASERAIVDAVRKALAAKHNELSPLLAAALEQSLERSLANERAGFLALLDRIDELWGGV
jgi:glycosyltransferase involved in cell wall biosynthesis